MGGSSSPTFNQAGLSNLSNVAGNNIPTNFAAGQQGYDASQNGIDWMKQNSGQADAMAWQGRDWNSILKPQAYNILSQGSDPQGALQAKLFQQQQDQGMAANAAAGTANTPYGAGLAQQGNQNFDINWQNQQLQRQATADQTAMGLSGAGMGALTQGLGADQSFMQALSGMGLNQTNAATSAGQALLNAINQAYGNTNQAYGNSIQQSNIQNQQQSQGLGGIGSLLGTLAGKFF